MFSIMIRCLAPAIAMLTAAAAVVPGAASAQGLPPGGSQFAEDPGVALSRHLVTIADDPRDLNALKGAAAAALALGDAQAALGFLARAEEISPRDARIKALMGSALVAMEQARPALRFFTEATALGVPEAEIAADRGLAYDLVGNPQQAQRDYQISLRRRDDAEIRRRLALSLGISGNRAAALQVIDAQLRQRDRAAWRTRAFVLALTGDAKGANEAVRAVMAPPAAAALEPFLARLPSLAPGDRAMAVHFGHFPDQRASIPSAPPTGPPASATNMDRAVGAGAPDPSQTPLGTSASSRVLTAQAQPIASPTTPQAAITGTPVQSQAEILPDGSRRERVDAAPPPPTATATLSALQSSIGPAMPAASATGPVAASSIQSVSIPASIDPVAASVPSSNSAPAAVPATPKPERLPFADIAALIEALPTAEEERAQRTQPATRPQARKEAPKPQPAAKPQVKKPAVPAEPSRIWVQIASGAKKESLPREFARLKAKAPALFKGKTGWTASARATNRLLVGPFKTDREARDFVNQLSKAQLDGFAWTSSAGQAVEKLPAR
jgi:Flp pilus assembly protein TadD